MKRTENSVKLCFLMFCLINLPQISENGPKSLSGVHFVSKHVVHVFVEAFSSVNPGDGDGLTEDDAEETDSGGAVRVAELEEVHPAVGGHRNGEAEAE